MKRGWKLRKGRKSVQENVRETVEERGCEEAEKMFLEVNIDHKWLLLCEKCVYDISDVLVITAPA